MDYNKIH